MHKHNDNNDTFLFFLFLFLLFLLVRYSSYSCVFLCSCIFLDFKKILLGYVGNCQYGRIARRRDAIRRYRCDVPRYHRPDVHSLRRFLASSHGNSWVVDLGLLDLSSSVCFPSPLSLFLLSPSFPSLPLSPLSLFPLSPVPQVKHAGTNFALVTQ
jgi:hypothetical protein